jgi:hypothetical protein
MFRLPAITTATSEDEQRNNKVHLCLEQETTA